MKEINEKIDNINFLKNRIRELEDFIYIIDVTNFLFTDLKIITKTEKLVSVNLFATRSFVIGKHEKNINVPLCIIPKITEIVKNELKECRCELENILNYETNRNIER